MLHRKEDQAEAVTPIMNPTMDLTMAIANFRRSLLRMVVGVEIEPPRYAQGEGIPIIAMAIADFRGMLLLMAVDAAIEPHQYALADDINRLALRRITLMATY